MKITKSEQPGGLEVHVSDHDGGVRLTLREAKDGVLTEVEVDFDLRTAWQLGLTVLRHAEMSGGSLSSFEPPRLRDLEEALRGRPRQAGPAPSGARPF
jgi:hypothetical protein